MSRLARLLSVCFVTIVPAVFASAGCGSDPVAVEGCRKIEEARCEASVSCAPFTVKDVTACKRFYRDQCLHGMAVGADPGEPVIDTCVATIKAAGACAASADPACVVPVTVPVSGSACDIIQHPERAVDCSFLAPSAPVSTAPTLPGTAGAGGTGGNGPASGGAGAGGSSGGSPDQGAAGGSSGGGGAGG